MESDTSVVEMENSDLTYTGTLTLNNELDVGDTFSLSTPKPIQKIFLNNFNRSNTGWGGPYYQNGDKVFSPNQTVELDISNQDSNAIFEVGGVLSFTYSITQNNQETMFGNITKIENLSNGNVKVSITDYTLSLMHI